MQKKILTEKELRKDTALLPVLLVGVIFFVVGSLISIKQDADTTTRVMAFVFGKIFPILLVLVMFLRRKSLKNEEIKITEDIITRKYKKEVVERKDGKRIHRTVYCCDSVKQKPAYQTENREKWDAIKESDRIFFIKIGEKVQVNKMYLSSEYEIGPELQPYVRKVERMPAHSRAFSRE